MARHTWAAYRLIAAAMTTRSRNLGVYIGIVWLVAAAVFWRSLPVASNATLTDLLIFVALAAISERWYVATSKESGMSLSFTVHFAAAVLFGPAFAMAVAMCGLLITDGLIRRAPRVRTAFNVPQMAISVGLCGLLYHALRVEGPLDLIADSVALAAAALVYLAVNDSLVAGVLSVTGRSFLQEWRLSFGDILLPYVSMAPLGALVAFTYQATPWSLLLFPPLVLVIYNGFKLFVSLQRETDDALVALADSIDRRDHYTYQHSVHVAEYVELAARRLKLAHREVDLIVAAARVHDLGKIGTDNRVLLKPSSLTPEEREMIRRHAADGAELAGKFSMFHKGRLFIRHHHERWDGTGYPDGLEGSAIPLGARLIAVADAYEAMTTDRPYRKALSPDAALMELRHCAGTQFDPAIVQALCEALAREGTATTLAPALEQLQPWQPDDIVAELSRGHDEAQLWAAASFTLSRLLNMPDCDLYRLEDDKVLACYASVRQGEWYPEYLGSTTPLAAWSGAVEAVNGRSPILMPSPRDARLGDAERAEMVRWNECAKVIVPLIVKDKTIGIVALGETSRDRVMTADRVGTAEYLCQLIALAVHDAQVIASQRFQARRLASLLESSRSVASAKSSEDAIMVVARKAVELFGITGCIAYEFDRELDALIPRAAWGNAPADDGRVSGPIALAEAPLERDLLMSGAARLQCVSDPDLDPVGRATMEMWREKSCLTVPMQSADGVMGLLTLWDSTHERRYTDDELALAGSLAELAGDAVRSATLLRRLQGLSETDSLTGLANHRKIHELLAGVQARAARYHSFFSVAMLDIDSFKQLNDTYGHPAGDAALRQVAETLKQQTRAADFAGRYGGDEFLLILPETTPAEATVLAEKLRAALADTPYTTPTGQNVHVRVSVGIAGYPEHGGTADDLIAAADASLYTAKRLGGDTISGGAAPAGRLMAPSRDTAA